jgi:hypothetical protein
MGFKANAIPTSGLRAKSAKLAIRRQSDRRRANAHRVKQADQLTD